MAALDFAAMPWQVALTLVVFITGLYGALAAVAGLRGMRPIAPSALTRRRILIACCFAATAFAPWVIVAALRDAGPGAYALAYLPVAALVALGLQQLGRLATAPATDQPPNLVVALVAVVAVASLAGVASAPWWAPAAPSGGGVNTTYQPVWVPLGNGTATVSFPGHGPAYLVDSADVVPSQTLHAPTGTARVVVHATAGTAVAVRVTADGHTTVLNVTTANDARGRALSGSELQVLVWHAAAWDPSQATVTVAFEAEGAIACATVTSPGGSTAPPSCGPATQA